MDKDEEEEEETQTVSFEIRQVWESVFNSLIYSQTCYIIHSKFWESNSSPNFVL